MFTNQQRHIYKTLNISLSTVHKIIKRFRESGAISKNQYWIDVNFGDSDSTALIAGVIV